MAAMTNLLCVFSIALLGLAVISSAYEPTYSHPQNPQPEQPLVPKVGTSLEFKVSHYTPKFHKVKKPEVNVPEVSKPEVPKEHPVPSYYGYSPKSIAIQGLVYCQAKGIGRTPIEGAVTRVTCLAVNENGYESAPFSTLSSPTNEKGYFFTTLPESAEYKLKKCKVFLEFSPLSTCKVPSDINNGVSGAKVGAYHFLPEKKLNLYSVGPFIYTPEQQAKPINGHY